MLKADVDADHQGGFTVGDRLLSLTISLFSWCTIIFILVKAWIYYIGRNGYWNRPIEKKKDSIDINKSNVREFNKVDQN